MISQFSKTQPFLSVEGNKTLNKKGHFNEVFRVFLPEIYTLSKSELEEINDVFETALRYLYNPEGDYGIAFHKQDWYLTELFRESEQKEIDKVSFLSHSSLNKFNERPFMKHSGFLSLGMYSNKTLDNSLQTTLLKPNLFSSAEKNPERIKHFFDQVEKFKEYINGHDRNLVKLESLSEEEYLGDENQRGIIEYYFNLTENENIIMDIDFSQGGVKVGRQDVLFYKVNELQDLPNDIEKTSLERRYSSDKIKFVTSSSISLGLDLTCNHIFNQYIFLDNSTEFLDKLRTHANWMQSLQDFSSNNGVNAANNMEFLNTVSDGAIPVRCHFNIMTWGDEPSLLRASEKAVSNAFRNIKIRAKMDNLNSPNLYWGGILGNGSDFPVDETLPTTLNIPVSLLACESNTPSSRGSYGVRLCDRRFGIPRLVDLSDEPMSRSIISNRNKFIIGPSGSGKSVLCNHMIRHYLEQGSHIVIVDIGHSYKKVAEEYGATYLYFDETTPLEFNPFIRDHNIDEEQKDTLVSLIFSLWLRDASTYENDAYKVIKDSINSYFSFLKKNEDVFPCFNTYYDFFKDVIVPQLEKDGIGKELFNLQSFLFVLKSFYKGGEFETLLNSKKNTAFLNDPFLIFELDNIQDNERLYPIISLMLMETFITKMRHLPKGTRKILVMEETWKALTKSGMSHFLKYCSKTVRKFFGELWVVTQEADDLIGSEIVKSTIIDGSDTKLIMDMSRYEQDILPIQKLLGLTDKELQMVTSINKSRYPERSNGKYKEVFISQKAYCAVYAVEITYEELAAYSTESKEVVEVEALVKRFNGDRHLAYRQFRENQENR